MSRIETEIWEPHPEKKGMVRYVGQRKTEDIFKELEDFLKKEDIYPDEYLLMAHNFELEYPLFPKTDEFICHANWGGSEGIYLDVELLVRDERNQRHTVHFITGKTLDESSEAYDRMQYIAGMIYKAFMGDNFYPTRYMIKESEDLRKQITYEKLISKLERECEAMLRKRLLHKQERLSEAAGEIGLTLQILDVLREPQIFADLPNDKLRELYETDDIMHRLYLLVEHIRSEDRWTIGDIIAAEPTLLNEAKKSPDLGDEEMKDTYYGFTHFSRMKYSNIPRDHSFIDEITFGLYARSGGCVSEASIVWEYLTGKPVFYVRSFGDGLKAAFSQKFIAIVNDLKTQEYFSPEHVARLLINEGFEDDSDRPLTTQAEQ